MVLFQRQEHWWTAWSFVLATGAFASGPDVRAKPKAFALRVDAERPLHSRMTLNSSWGGGKTVVKWVRVKGGQRVAMIAFGGTSGKHLLSPGDFL